MAEPFKIVRRAADLGEIANKIDQARAVGLDLETTSLSPHLGDIRLCSLNVDGEIYVVDLFETGTFGPVPDALASSKSVKVGQNLKFDQGYLLHKYGLELWPVFDTFRASALIYNGKEGGNDLYSIYHRELGVQPEAPDLGGSDWTGPLSPEQYQYSAEDVTYLLKLREVMKPKLARDGLNRVALIEFRAILGEAAMELNGFYLDRDKWMTLYEENRARRDILKEEVFRLLPHPKGLMGLPGMTPGWNLASPKQKLDSLRLLGLPVDNTREMTLAMFASKFPAVTKLIQFTKTNKLCTSFGPAYLENINPVTGRIHSSYYPFTGAGRYSCSKPNLQQIPRSKAFRACFAPPPGRGIVVADYSQIELRLAAEISGDRLLMETYRQGLDAHKQTAALVNAVAMEAVTKDMRQYAKPVNFGLIYGMGSEKLVLYAQSAYGISMTLGQAEAFRRRYFEGYAGVKDWHYRAMSQGKRTGIARTLSGRIRYLKEDAHNEILNTPVQGSGADGLKASFPLVYEVLKKYGGRAKLVHMVHDEFVIETDDNREEMALIAKDLETAMVEGMQPFLPRVPVVVEGGYGPSWAEK